MKSLLNSALGLVDARLVRKSSYEKLLSNANRFRDYELSSLIDEKYFQITLQTLSFQSHN